MIPELVGNVFSCFSIPCRGGGRVGQAAVQNCECDCATVLVKP